MTAQVILRLGRDPEASNLLDYTQRCLGYRSMWRCLKTLGHRVSRDVVLLAMRFVDQNAVAARKRRRLKRRDYASQGPNFCWHIDGYDKLKPFGFAIHGDIDGFSR